MNVIVVVVIGAIIGAIDGVGIFFAPGEPFKTEIFLAAILKGILVSFLTGTSLTTNSGRWHEAGYELLYGLAFALALVLAIGGFKSKDGRYVGRSGAIL